jgi:hypothetical protein
MKIITNRPIITRYNNGAFSNAIGDNIADKLAEKYGDTEGFEKTPATADDKKMVLDQMAAQQGNAPAKKQGIFKRAIAGQKKATGGSVDKYYSDEEISKRQGLRGTKRTERKTQRGIRKSERVAERKSNKDRRRATRRAKKDARALKKTTKNGKDIYQDKIPPLTKDATGNFIKTNPDGSTTVIPKEETKVITNSNGTTTTYDNKDISSTDKVIQQINPVTKQNELIGEYTEEQTEVALDDKGNEQVYKKADVGGMSKGLKIGLIVGGSVVGLALIGLIIYKLKKK